MPHQPSKSEELQPCPFCGGKAQRSLTKVRYDSLFGDPYQDHIVGCFNSNCPVHPAITHCNENCAVTEWNTRHTRQSHQPSKSNEEVAQALMMKTAQQGGLHTRDIIKALQDKDAEREKAVEKEKGKLGAEVVFEALSLLPIQGQDRHNKAVLKLQNIHNIAITPNISNNN